MFGTAALLSAVPRMKLAHPRSCGRLRDDVLRDLPDINSGQAEVIALCEGGLHNLVVTFAALNRLVDKAGELLAPLRLQDAKPFSQLHECLLAVAAVVQDASRIDRV